jgi:SAM-dependent methyltransferase
VQERHRSSALRARELAERGLHDRAKFQAALLDVPSNARDAWLDLVLGLGELPDDGAALPRGCVPYLPCSVDALLAVIEHAGVTASDVFVDLGSGLGRPLALVHLLTGASAIGIEIQPALVHGARELATRLQLSKLQFLEGEAAELTGSVAVGTVFFLYCPFGAERLAKVLQQLEELARTMPLRIGCVDLPLPSCTWLTPEPTPLENVAIYRSTRHSGGVFT